MTVVMLFKKCQCANLQLSQNALFKQISMYWSYSLESYFPLTSVSHRSLSTENKSSYLEFNLNKSIFYGSKCWRKMSGIVVASEKLTQFNLEWCHALKRKSWFICTNLSVRNILWQVKLLHCKCIYIQRVFVVVISCEIELKNLAISITHSDAHLFDLLLSQNWNYA